MLGAVVIPIVEEFYFRGYCIRRKPVFWHPGVFTAPLDGRREQ